MIWYPANLEDLKTYVPRSWSNLSTKVMVVITMIYMGHTLIMDKPFKVMVSYDSANHRASFICAFVKPHLYPTDYDLD